MPLSHLLQKYSTAIFMGGFLLMYAFGVLSPQHYAVGDLDAYINSIALLFVIIGALIWYAYHPVLTVSKSSYIWLASILLFFLQPLIHHIDYIDSLIFPIGIMATAFFVSTIVTNFDTTQKMLAMQKIAWLLAIVGCLLVLTQALQLFFPAIPQILVMPLATNGTRLGGNIAQVNQASFVIALGVASVLYLVSQYQTVFLQKKLYILMAVLSLFWLGTGIGFAASRGGLLLLAASIFGSLFYPWQSKQRYMIGVVVATLLTVLGYNFGTQLFNHYIHATEEVSAVGRFVGENSLGIRTSLLKQAWLMFLQSPITGLGYASYGYFGLQHPELPWFNIAAHAHNIVAQIAAEFGLLGLLCFAGFVYVIVQKLPRFITRRLAGYQAFCMVLLTIIGLYSLSEFPLWYARFLILTAFLIAILDEPIKFNNHHVNKVFVMILSLFTVMTGYYIIKYDDYLKSDEMITRLNLPYKERVQAYEALPPVFGYTKYKESLFYTLMPLDPNKLNEQITLGERVIKAYPHNYIAEKQATMLAYADRKEEAQTLYHALCRLEQTGNILTEDNISCPETIKGIEEVNPPDAQHYIADVIEWRDSHPH